MKSLVPCWIALALLASCQATSGSVASLATTRVAADRDLYSLRRIGILPVRGVGMRAEDARAFEGALAAQLGAKWHAEIVPLESRDVEAVPENESFRLGRIEPDAILKLSRRYNLDALVQATFTERRAYAPQRLGVEVELTSCETGLPIWSASLRLDGASERMQQALHQWFAEERQSDAGGEAWELYLLSPVRFAEFAAAQVALAY